MLAYIPASWIRHGYDVGIEPHRFGNTKQSPMPSHGMLRVPDLRVHPPSSSIAQPADGCKDLKTFIRKPFKNYGNHICFTPVQTWGHGLKRQIYCIYIASPPAKLLDTCQSRSL